MKKNVFKPITIKNKKAANNKNSKLKCQPDKIGLICKAKKIRLRKLAKYLRLPKVGLLYKTKAIATKTKPGKKLKAAILAKPKNPAKIKDLRSNADSGARRSNFNFISIFDLALNNLIGKLV